ncbi:uncharacterized protein F5147DRAFT_583138 [Suillus discolor]|uniref:DH domain-containing protein n=1 Tax=Suillus discolor TaxID=1912936 RepID=A0A9P7F089_9AGAM|nr:uncharacterized protein F5147DRAFT_583138 [Suillus discolor]KAG2098447.1 hypothetical protein F5147DRAFT_583138 [Suillus discolor]
MSSQQRSEEDSTTAPPIPAPAITKRQHALLELLTSERAYASDLALIRDVYMRLASGHPPSFGFSCTRPVSGSEISNPGSSSSSESTKSSSGTCSSFLRPVGEPPLSVADTRIIFRNISELAVLSDMLVSKLEIAIEEGGKGVGEIFLEVVPLFAPPYTTYITAHPRALAHLDALNTPPQLTPQFSRWLKESKELVEAHTHAWDLPSLLIKPVQRLLKYGLLLGAVISATPEPLGAEGLDKLREAKQKVEEVARAVNEGRRRVEVVREVLGSGHSKDGPGAGSVGSIGIPKVGVVNASVSRMQPDSENAEAALLVALESRLKSHITTLSHLARDAFGYARTLHTLFGALVKWGWAFSGVIGVTVSPELEAFDAFLSLCTGLVDLVQELEHELHAHILPSLQSLKGTSVAPLKLLSALHTLQPLHMHLLHLPITRKNRPPEALLQASQSYVALRGQLALELPVYVKLLERGIDGVVLDLARAMDAFWRVVMERWGELWDALQVEGEDNMEHADRPAGGGETVRVWRERWGDVLGVLGSLAIVNPPRKMERLRPPRSFQNSYDHRSSQSSSSSFNPASRASHSHPNSYDITGRRRSGSTNNIPTGPIARKLSDESLRSGKSGKSGKSYKSNLGPGANIWRGIEDVPPMPSALQLPSQFRSGVSPPRLKPTRMKSLPGPIISNIPFGLDPPPSPSSFATFDEEQEDNDRDRGRVQQRRPSLKSKITDTFRPSHHRTRSSSVKSLGAPSSLAPSYYTTDSALPAYQMPPTPTRTQSPHTPTRRTTDLQGLRALYQCAAIHMCIPPAGVSYRGLPFFELRSGDTFDVLREYGHPSTHPDLPLYVDDGEDCLLLVRELVDAEGGGRDAKVRGEVGWALASFLVPLD